MRLKGLILFFIVVGSIGFTSCGMLKKEGKATGEEEKEKEALFNDKMDSLSYIIGHRLANDLKSQDMDWDSSALIRGFKDAFNNVDTVIPEVKANQMMRELQAELRAKHQETQEKKSQKARSNLSESKSFLEQNKQKEGVKTTETGLQYRVIREGTGTSPDANDKVTVHYKGYLIDSTVFDNSYERKEPASFSVNGVIEGWKEGLQLMKSGAKYQFFIPPDLAYGKRGVGGAIGPNQALIFEVELLEVEKVE